MTRSSKSLSLMIAGFLLAGQIRAADTAETFEFFREEAKVVTASRYAQPVSEAPMAVHVITAEEIQASGAVNLWDLFRFAPGMDVSDSRTSDGNRAIVSVRGFPSAYVSNLQVLVDGRSVYTSLTGGVTWQGVLVQMQDIERIEIARGPNAALYGSNAAIGTINIITKRPAADRTLAAQARVGNLGTETTSASYEDASRKFGLRASHTYMRTDGFRTIAGADGGDHQNTNNGNLRGFFAPRDGTEVEFFAGALSSDYQLSGLLAGRPANLSKRFEMIKLSQAVGSSAVDLLIAHRRGENEVNPSPDIATRQIDVELQHRFSWLNDRVQTTWGGSFREAGAESSQLFAREPRQRNEIRRGFTQQSLRATDRLTLTGAFSYEDSDTGGSLIAYQAASLYRLTPRQILRASYALAPTLPTIFSKAGDYQTNPFLYLVGNPDLDASQIRSTELGYQGFFRQRRLQTSADLYYADVSNLPRADTRTRFFPTLLVTRSFRNGNRIKAKGVETALKYNFDRGGSMYLNYTYAHETDQAGDVSITGAVPEHKFNIGGIARLGQKLMASLNAGYKDGYRSSNDLGSARISAYWRLDARLAYQVKNVELFVAGQNLARPEKVENADGLAVPRTYQTGVTVEFGGRR